MKSKAYMSDLIAGKTVEVDYDKYDRYGRVLGIVMVNGEDVNLEQVEAGMAWHSKACHPGHAHSASVTRR